MNNRPFAKQLRVAATDAERRLWPHLRDRRLAGYKFCRQFPLDRYIVDFVCREGWLVVEVDGGQHADSPADKQRDEALQRLGYRTLRFWNNDVLLNTNGVLETIRQALIGGIE